VLTERELLFQQQILNIHSRVGQLSSQLANYRVLDSSIRQALGFAVTHRHRAHDTHPWSHQPLPGLDGPS